MKKKYKIILTTLVALGVMSCRHDGIVGDGIVVAKECTLNNKCACFVALNNKKTHPLIVFGQTRGFDGDFDKFWVECGDSVSVGDTFKFSYVKNKKDKTDETEI